MPVSKQVKETIEYFEKNPSMKRFRNKYPYDVVAGMFDSYEKAIDILGEPANTKIIRMIESRVDELKSNRRQVFRYYFKNNSTLKEVAEKIGITAERVRQIKNLVCADLRRTIGGEVLKESRRSKSIPIEKNVDLSSSALLKKDRRNMRLVNEWNDNLNVGLSYYKSSVLSDYVDKCCNGKCSSCLLSEAHTCVQDGENYQKYTCLITDKHHDKKKIDKVIEKIRLV